MQDAIALAPERGTLTIGLACNARRELEETVDIMIHSVIGPEVPAGSTRLKVGTAQKMVLNLLRTETTVLLGKIFGNLIVTMRTTNVKLRDRSVRILRTVTGLGDRVARDLLMHCDGELKVAIVAGLAGTDAAGARERLAHSGGIIRAAVEENRFPVGDLI